MRSETEVSCSCGLVSERLLALTPTTLSVLQPAVNISAPKCIATSIPGPPNFASPSYHRPPVNQPAPPTATASAQASDHPVGDIDPCLAPWRLSGNIRPRRAARPDSALPEAPSRRK